MPHRAVFEKVPDVAFHATYIGQLLGLYLAYKVAQVKRTMVANRRNICVSAWETLTPKRRRSGVAKQDGVRAAICTVLVIPVGCRKRYSSMILSGTRYHRALWVISFRVYFRRIRK